MGGALAGDVGEQGEARRAGDDEEPGPQSGIEISTGITAPITHTIWNRTSKAANDRPRLASGASRCTSESKASRPAVDTTATTPASSMLAASPPTHAATSAAGDRHGQQAS